MDHPLGSHRGGRCALLTSSLYCVRLWKRGFMSRGQGSWGPLARILVFAVVVVLGARIGWSQELGGAGTVQGTVKDPTGGVMTAVTVELSNPVTGLRRSATTDASGRFVFRNLPPNSYHV